MIIPIALIEEGKVKQAAKPILRKSLLNKKIFAGVVIGKSSGKAKLPRVIVVAVVDEPDYMGGEIVDLELWLGMLRTVYYRDGRKLWIRILESRRRYTHAEIVARLSNQREYLGVKGEISIEVIWV